LQSKRYLCSSYLFAQIVLFTQFIQGLPIVKIFGIYTPVFSV